LARRVWPGRFFFLCGFVFGLAFLVFVFFALVCCIFILRTTTLPLFHRLFFFFFFFDCLRL
jgi:hypothetical protein